MTGYFEGAADFDPANDKVAKLNTNAIQTLFVASYNAETAAYGYAFSAGYHYENSLSKIKSLKTDAKGNIVVVGYFEGAISFDKKSKNQRLTEGRWADIFVAKYDSVGNFLWVKQFGGNSKDICHALDIDAQGNIYIGGYFEEKCNFATMELTASAGKDAFFAKLDSNGNMLWVKQLKGLGDDQVWSLKLNADGSAIHLLGSFEDQINLNPTGTSELRVDKALFLAKYNSKDGGFIWGAGLEGRIGLDLGPALVLDDDNNIYTTGLFSGVAAFDRQNITVLKSLGADDIFLCKYNGNNGNLVWAKRMGGNRDDRGTALIVSKDGFIYCAGRFSAGASFGTLTLNAVGAEDAFLTKYSKNGDFVWAKAMGGASHEEALALAEGAEGNIFIAGYFQGTADFDNNKLSSLSIINSDMFLAKYSPDGNCLWTKGFGGVLSDQASALHIPASGAIYMAANFQGIVDFDPTAAVVELKNEAIPSSAALAKFLDFEFSKIQYVDMKASRLNADEVSLSWTSASEENNAGFEVERKLEGSEEFSKVGFIPGFGSSSQPTNYRFSDKNAFDGTSYYRFRQIDFSGKGTYSAIMTVSGLPSGKVGRITLYPLPVSTELNIRFGTMPADVKSAKLSIINGRGKVIHEFTAGVSSNELLEIDEVKGFDKGRYVVSIEYNNGTKTTQEFVKE
jgi:hypothetical protein